MLRLCACRLDSVLAAAENGGDAATSYAQAMAEAEAQLLEGAGRKREGGCVGRCAGGRPS